MFTTPESNVMPPRAPMSSSFAPRNPRKAGLGIFGCVVLSCVVAPPIVRGAAAPAQVDDGGGCNGGRAIHFGEEDSETTGGESSSSGDTSESSEPGSCGDGAQDPGEGCDDGNAADDDTCPSGEKGQCQASATCGDGMVWAGQEACDDGNIEGGDGCEADCTLTPAQCGNSVKEPGEACDDGNEVEEDVCPSGAVGQCKAEANCGDGFVWMGVEVCDDGNGGEEDACPSGGVGQCKAEASCGDGFVWGEMEGCDDGNVEDTDACPSGAGACMAGAVCGDGFVQAGAEDCDDMNAEDLDECNNACARPRWVFVTSGNGPNNNGNLGGVAGADAYCQTFAEGVGLPGSYMAWLTGMDPGSAPATRFASTAFTGWYLLPSDPPTPVALGWSDLTNPNRDVPANYLKNAIYLDETGKEVGDGTVWTNTNPDGTQQMMSAHCGDWKSASFDISGQVGRAKVGVVDLTWTTAATAKCTSGNRLYCFQVK